MRRFFLLAALFCPAAAAAAGFVPHPALNWDAAPQEIADGCQSAKARAEMDLTAIVRLPASARTFDNTVAGLDRALADLKDRAASAVFLKYVSVSSAARDAANDCETSLGQFQVDVFTREDLYAALGAYAAKKEALAKEDKRLLEKTLLAFERNGLGLPLEKREALKSIRKRLVQLEADFGKNLNEVTDAALFTREELEGLPEDFIARLSTEGARYKVTVKYPDYFPVMDNARRPQTRRRMEALFNNRAAKANLPILKEAIRLRAEAAQLLGHKNHAEFVLTERMAKNPETVWVFLRRLERRLKPLGKKELAELLALKEKEEGSEDRVLRAWDWRYYDNQLVKARYQVDHQAIKDYFPLERVTEGMFGVYQRLFGVKFTERKDAALWHPDVRLYEIADAAGGEPFAYFYMDLFPRDGKYGHAAAFDLVLGRALPDGSYQKPVAALVANFEKPAAGRPSLLRHGPRGEIETYFHEFGHIMHQTLTRARHARFSGANTAWDFVEAPSQMLENWIWDPALAAELSGHYQDPAKKIPAELFARVRAARRVNEGLKSLRQIFFGAIDMTYHTQDAVEDTTAEYRRLMERVSLIPMSPGTHPEASFGHLFGYDAGYYSYMWSKVYAEDMFSRFEAEGLLNTALGRRYRQEILEKGGGRDELDSVRAFLGRDPSEDAFLKSLGLDPKES